MYGPEILCNNRSLKMETFIKVIFLYDVNQDGSHMKPIFSFLFADDN
jgi:hypothetical protein